MAGNLDNIRDQSRASVHAQFALPAIIRDQTGEAIGTASVRLHRANSRPFGDLDREGFAFTIEDRIVVIFDSVEHMPARNQVVDFGRGRVFNIDAVTPNNGDRYVNCIVTESKVTAP